jgi:hypothetical protein
VIEGFEVRILTGEPGPLIIAGRAIGRVRQLGAQLNPGQRNLAVEGPRPQGDAPRFDAAHLGVAYRVAGNPDQLGELVLLEAGELAGYAQTVP